MFFRKDKKQNQNTKMKRVPITPKQLSKLADENHYMCFPDNEDGVWPKGIDVFMIGQDDCYIYYMNGNTKIIQEIYEKEKASYHKSANKYGTNQISIESDDFNHYSVECDGSYFVISKIDNTLMYSVVHTQYADMVKHFFGLAGYAAPSCVQSNCTTNENQSDEKYERERHIEPSTSESGMTPLKYEFRYATLKTFDEVVGSRKCCNTQQVEDEEDGNITICNAFLSETLENDLQLYRNYLTECGLVDLGHALNKKDYWIKLGPDNKPLFIMILIAEGNLCTIVGQDCYSSSHISLPYVFKSGYVKTLEDVVGKRNVLENELITKNNMRQISNTYKLDSLDRDLEKYCEYLKNAGLLCDEKKENTLWWFKYDDDGKILFSIAIACAQNCYCYIIGGEKVVANEAQQPEKENSKKIEKDDGKVPLKYESKHGTLKTIEEIVGPRNFREGWVKECDGDIAIIKNRYLSNTVGGDLRQYCAYLKNCGLYNNNNENFWVKFNDNREPLFIVMIEPEEKGYIVGFSDCYSQNDKKQEKEKFYFVASRNDEWAYHHYEDIDVKVLLVGESKDVMKEFVDDRQSKRLNRFHSVFYKKLTPQQIYDYMQNHSDLQAVIVMKNDEEWETLKLKDIESWNSSKQTNIVEKTNVTANMQFETIYTLEKLGFNPEQAMSICNMMREEFLELLLEMCEAIKHSLIDRRNCIYSYSTKLNRTLSIEDFCEDPSDVGNLYASYIELLKNIFENDKQVTENELKKYE